MCKLYFNGLGPLVTLYPKKIPYRDLKKRFPGFVVCIGNKVHIDVFFYSMVHYLGMIISKKSSFMVHKNATYPLPTIKVGFYWDKISLMETIFTL